MLSLRGPPPLGAPASCHPASQQPLLGAGGRRPHVQRSHRVWVSASYSLVLGQGLSQEETHKWFKRGNVFSVSRTQRHSNQSKILSRSGSPWRFCFEEHHLGTDVTTGIIVDPARQSAPSRSSQAKPIKSFRDRDAIEFIQNGNFLRMENTLTYTPGKETEWSHRR